MHSLILTKLFLIESVFVFGFILLPFDEICLLQGARHASCAAVYLYNFILPLEYIKHKL